MKHNKQIHLAEQFQALHQQDLFIILNVWNAGSALVFQKKGFKALATTSAGIAYSMGLPDGEYLSLDDLCDVTRQITRRVSLPLSIDFDRGYGDSPEEVKNSARQLLDAGAVGFNIEDGLEKGQLDELDKQLLKIEALVELRNETKIPFVINARTCAYWLKVEEEKERLQVAIERGNAFAQAGADCVFIPGAMDEAIVTKLVNAIDRPVNIIANPVFHDFETMRKIGVRRISIGSGAVRSVFNHLLNIADDLKDGRIDQMINHDFSYAAANDFFKL